MNKRELKDRLERMGLHRASLDRPLTDRQREVLSFVVAHRDKFGFPPTRNEICLAFGFASPNAADQHLLLLARKGYLKLSRAARSIEVLRAA